MARRLHYFFKIGIKFTYREMHRSVYFLAVVGLCCRLAWASPVAVAGATLLVLCGLLIAVASTFWLKRLKLLQLVGSVVWLVRSKRAQ